MHPWWDPLCTAPVFDLHRWDLSPCFQRTVLAALSISLFFLLGGLEVRALLRRYAAGERPELGGQGARAIKVVRTFSTREAS